METGFWKSCIVLLLEGKVLKIALALAMTIGLFPRSVALADGCAIETADEGEAAEDLVELIENGYIVDWTKSGTCEWSIDAEGTLVVRPADGAATGTMWSLGSPWSSYSRSIKAAKVIGTVKVNQTRQYFSHCSSLTSVDLSGLDTSSVTDMGSMFSHCSSLTSVDLSGLDTSSVTDMGSMFSDCSSLTSIDLSGLDTSSVTDMDLMFFRCRSLTSVDLTGLDTSRVCRMMAMFSDCSSLTSIDLSGLDTSSVTGMGSMFSDCSSLTSIDLSGLDTSSVTDMGSMFSDCSSLTSIDLSGLDTSSVTDMGVMFANCSSLTSVDLSGLDTSSVEDMGSMFSRCGSLVSIDLSGLDTSSVTGMGSMFSDCSSLTSIDLSGLDTSSVTDMGVMFANCSSLTSVDLSGLDVSNVADMSCMFSRCSSLVSIDLSDFDASAVTNMTEMFSRCSSLTSIDLSGLDISNVMHMRSMFYGCSSLTSVDLSGLDTSSVEDMGGMFMSCSSLTSVDLSGLDTSSVTDMGSMFSHCSSLTSVDLSGLDTSNVESMRSMFSGCAGLRKITLGSKFSFCGVEEERQCSFPEPSGEGLSGKWVSSVDGIAYSNNAIPNNVAATYVAEGYDGLIPTPNPEEEIPSSLFTTSITFNATVSDSGFATTDVNWDDGWFNTSSYIYNHDLATTAAVLSASAYKEKNIKSGLRKQLGFDAFEPDEYHPETGEYQNDYDQVGYSIETRMTSNGVPIIAVIVRGTPGNEEWLSNLNIADSNKGWSRTHEGFSEAANKVLTEFRNYVKRNNIDLDRARVLVTGHSRGASVANIVGARLDEGEGDVKGCGSLSGDRIYDFTFESPTSTTVSEKKNSTYDNIFNIMNPEDVVTRVPLSETGWGYGRYGKDLYFPSKSNTNSDSYKAHLYYMNVYFKQYTDGKTYSGCGSGVLLSKAICVDVLALSPTTPLYYGSSYMLGLASPERVFKAIVRIAITKTADVGDYATVESALLVKQYRHLLCSLFGLEIADGQFNIADEVKYGHTQETYVSWMKSATAGIGDIPRILSSKKFRIMSVACPVDVKVYDASGNLVAAIADDQVDESLLGSGLSAVVTSDGTKMVSLPADGEYRVEMVATDAGEMDVTIEESDGSGDDPESVKAYQGVPLQEGETFALDAAATSDVGECVLIDSATGSEAQATSIVSGSNPDRATVSVSAEGSGSAWGGGTVIKGSKTFVYAKAAAGFKFIRWERATTSDIDGSQKRELVEGGSELEVQASENATYIAVFNEDESIAPDGYIVGWTPNGSCEWAIDSTGALVVRPANGAAEGELEFGLSFGDYAARITSARFEGRIKCSAEGISFSGCTALTSLDLTGLDTSRVTSMAKMFSWCCSLTSIDLSGIDTSQVSDMEGMFGGCFSLESLNLSGLDTSNVAGMRNIFAGCDGLKSISLGRKFSFCGAGSDRLCSLPEPSGGRLTGKWTDSSNGKVYASDCVPNNVAATYVAEMGEPTTQRLYGGTRYDTMAAISKEGFDSAEYVILASGENFPDALGASALAGSLDAPVLLTNSTELSSQAASEIERLGASKVLVVGGNSAISPAVESSLRAKGLLVDRISGSTRQQTAVKVADKVTQLCSPDTVIIASGASAWDSLSVSPFAYSKRYPVYLAEGDGTISSETLSAIQGASGVKRVVIVGGAAAVSEQAVSKLSSAGLSVERWFGQTRYETSRVIAEHAVAEGTSPATVAVASGENFPDALSGGALVGSRGGMLLLSPVDDAPQAAEWLSPRKDQVVECYLLGGSAALGDGVRQRIDSALRA